MHEHLSILGNFRCGDLYLAPAISAPGRREITLNANLQITHTSLTTPALLHTGTLVRIHTEYDSIVCPKTLRLAYAQYLCTKVLFMFACKEWRHSNPPGSLLAEYTVVLDESTLSSASSSRLATTALSATTTLTMAGCGPREQKSLVAVRGRFENTQYQPLVECQHLSDMILRLCVWTVLVHTLSRLHTDVKQKCSHAMSRKITCWCYLPVSTTCCARRGPEDGESP